MGIVALISLFPLTVLTIRALLCLHARKDQDMAATRDRHFRCDDELWAAAKSAAAAEHRTVTDVLVAALRRLVAER